METKTLTPAEQFAQDWLLIADNNSYEFYNELREKAHEADNVVQLSEVLREEWETLVEQVSDLVNRSISPIASDFVTQILGYWGSRPFDLIAEELLNREGENA